MKVLFLDIDGVLNSSATEERVESSGPFKGYIGIDAILLSRFKDWLVGKDLSVVLSSAWRNHEHGLRELRSKGLSWIDVTPNHGRFEDRGLEIEEWMQGKNIEAFAILDDNMIMLQEQDSNFVQTDYRIGVTEEDLKKVDKILKESR